MPDTPTLKYSAAARDSTPTTPLASPPGKHFAPMPSPNRFHENQDATTTHGSSDTGGLQADYFGNSFERPGMPHRPDSSDLRSGVASPIMPEVTTDLQTKPTTEIRAGLSQKSFRVATDLLISKSPYFASIQKLNVITTSNYPQTSTRLSGPFSFPELNEFAMALFVRWLYGGELHGPRDFHTTNHYMCLYVLAAKFEIETLKNTVMDLVRDYYHQENMTAPAFRLDYIYTNTNGPCLMREFLVMTAAYRALSEGPRSMSDSVKNALKAGGDVAVDFVEALIVLAENDKLDVRRGDPCLWHEHESTHKCVTYMAEPYESP